MSLVAVSISEAEIGEGFEACALGREGEANLRKKLLATMAASPLDEAVVLSTCARVEVYFLASQFHATVDEVARVLAAELGLEDALLQGMARVLYGPSAVRHLLRVVCGIESAIIGESEIQAQTKSAISLARECGLARSKLTRIFEHALEVAKRVRSETAIGSGNASVTSVAASIALSEGGVPRVGVVGTGTIGSEVAKILRDRGAKVTVLSAMEDRLSRIRSELVAIDTLPASRLPESLASFDSIIFATSNSHYLLDRSHLDGEADLKIVDLCRPRSVDPLVAGVAGVALFDLDEVNKMVSGQLAQREFAIGDAEAIIESELDLFEELERVQDLNPLLKELYERAETTRSVELARTLRRLHNLDPAVQLEMEILTHRIVAKLLHSPASALRERGAEDEYPSFIDDFKTIFGL